jgi:hypothetical protein
MTMAKQIFTVRFYFVSTSRYNDDYTVDVAYQARNAAEAIALATLDGGSRFGARFTENCTDWQISA